MAWSLFLTLIKQCHILKVLFCLNEYVFQDRVDVLGNKYMASKTKNFFFFTIQEYIVNNLSIPVYLVLSLIAIEKV